jgi:hypothetical protein
MAAGVWVAVLMPSFVTFIALGVCRDPSGFADTVDAVGCMPSVRWVDESAAVAAWCWQCCGQLFAGTGVCPGVTTFGCGPAMGALRSAVGWTVRTISRPPTDETRAFHSRSLSLVVKPQRERPCFVEVEVGFA